MKKKIAIFMAFLTFSIMMTGIAVNIQKAHATLQGDINNDGVVDMRDISFIAYYFGSFNGTKAHPHGWNPIADVNGDQRVDMIDLAITAKNFGKTG